MNKTIIIFALCLAGVLSVSQFSTEWRRFKTLHNKQYSSESEELRRYEIFVENLRHINQHNANYENDHETYALSINDKSDMTWEEFRAYYKLSKPLQVPVINDKVKLSGEIELPDMFSWLIRGAVTPARDQGDCGSCWSFAATGVLEGAYYVRYKQLKTLSTQQPVDCDHGNFGCLGGHLDSALEYFKEEKPMLDSDYRYNGFESPCKYDPRKAAMPTIRSYERVESNMNSLMESLVANGPHSIGIDADHGNFLHYRSGVFKTSSCSSIAINHAVLLVGYGQENELDFWLIKNSWGSFWGINGFVKLYKSVDNMCGVMTAPFIVKF